MVAWTLAMHEHGLLITLQWLKMKIIYLIQTKNYTFLEWRIME
jgi:hypothetical protein